MIRGSAVTVGFDAKLIMPDGTTVEYDAVSDCLWVHPKGRLSSGSYRVNLRLRMVDEEI